MSWLPNISRVRLVDAGIVMLVSLLVGLPALLVNNGFAADYTNHLWLV